MYLDVMQSKEDKEMLKKRFPQYVPPEKILLNLW